MRNILISDIFSAKGKWCLKDYPSVASWKRFPSDSPISGAPRSEEPVATTSNSRPRTSSSTRQSRSSCRATAGSSARARDQGSRGHAPARGRCGTGRTARWNQGLARHLLQSRQLLRHSHQRRSGLHRLRRARAKAAQLPRWRARDRGLGGFRQRAGGHVSESVAIYLPAPSGHAPQTLDARFCLPLQSVA